MLGYLEWLTGLQRGIAAHHAGMLPTFKEVVEELFEAGLVRAVFATETLALGINMPARTVVIERLDKWNGETHADLTPGEYTQLTGRAGRRGIDVEGHAVVLWQPGVDPLAVAGLAGTRTYPLNSSFRPSYNMAVNLVGQAGLDKAAALLESSFAQFQADRAVVGIARQARRSRAALDELGVDLRPRRLRRVPRAAPGAVRAGGGRRPGPGRRTGGPQARRSLEQLRRGDIILVPAGRRSGLAVVLDPGLAGGNSRGGNGRAGHDGNAPLPLVLTIGRQVKRLSLADFPTPVSPIDRLRIPNNFSARSPQHRRDLAASLRNKLAGRDIPRPGRPEPPRAQEDIAQAAPAAAPASVSRLPGPGRARPGGGAADPAGARGGQPGGQRGRPVARDRAHLPAGLRGPGAARLPGRRPGHPGRQAARRPVHRAGPAGRGVPAPRAVGRPGPGRAGRLRVGADVRVPAERRRRPGPDAGRPGAGRGQLDGVGLG